MTTTTGRTTKEAGTVAPDDATTVDLTAPENSPERKRTKNTNVPSLIKESNRYTTKSFSIATTAHSYNHPRTFVEAAIALTKEDKPREFIAAIKLLLSNGKILDPNFALAPLKRDTAMKKPPKLITAEDDVPINFTHLGQYIYTSGNRIFEKKKDWKGNNSSKKADHGDNDNTTKEDIFHDPVVYFTIAITTDAPPPEI
jgi:hypothetical protein